MRKVLFQIHLWTGLVAGLYGLLIGVTGSALMFRADYQARAYPQFFAAAATSEPADPDIVIAELRRQFPGHRFNGFDYPTARRGTLLAYLASADQLRTVFLDAASGRVIGELPRDGWIQQLQELHFNVLAGSTGITINGIGASCLLVLCLTGPFIWWPGTGRWPQHLAVHLRRSWKRITWELHGAAGMWLWILLTMWAVSGIYFSFPVPFRNGVSHLFRLSTSRAPLSQPATSSSTPPTGATLVAHARTLVPGAQLVRFTLPFGERGAYAVVLARPQQADADANDEITVYFDRYSGALLEMTDRSGETAGDRLMTWLGRLHVGSFGGLPVRIVWFVTGLGFPVLFVTGVVMWWNRKLRRSVQPRAVSEQARR